MLRANSNTSSLVQASVSDGNSVPCCALMLVTFSHCTQLLLYATPSLLLNVVLTIHPEMHSRGQSPVAAGSCPKIFVPSVERRVPSAVPGQPKGEKSVLIP